ncbi:hypothetical protein EDB81DRAFT_803231, partial [Dactylonectria macrodidyma]
MAKAFFLCPSLWRSRLAYHLAHLLDQFSTMSMLRVLAGTRPASTYVSFQCRKFVGVTHHCGRQDPSNVPTQSRLWLLYRRWRSIQCH